MNESESKNTYLDQVQEQQQVLEQNLKAKRVMKMAVQSAGQDRGRASQARVVEAPAEPGGNAVDVRVTGWARWKTVIVPPNAYVVHTRRGHAEPLHIGLGVSFPYNPYRDAFLVVPGAMQTILINAKCICRERQGILVQGYVQWIIQDFATAYKKLDFSDVEEPMRLVALQLREQAEAAIKDKVASMSIDDVLADKEPIIEELTTRLRSVAEGAGGSDKGLGLRIVTVQIKEAVVSSARLWDNLQKPFRAERAKVARLAELESEEAVKQRELDQRRRSEGAELDVERELAGKRAQSEAEAFDREQTEHVRQTTTTQENTRALAAEEQATRLRTMELEKQRHAAELELERTKLDAQLGLERLKLDGTLAMQLSKAQTDYKQQELAAAAAELRQRIENQLSPAALNARLVASLPDIMAKLPKPAELRQVSIGGSTDSLAGAVAQVLAVLHALQGMAPVDAAKKA